MAGLRVGLEQRDGLEHSFRHPDVEPIDLNPSGSSKENSSHTSPPASVLPLREVGSDVIERRDPSGFEVRKTTLYGAQRGRVRQDLGRFLEALVLVDRNDRRRRPTVAGHDDVLTSIGDVIEDLGELGSQLLHGHGLGHARSVHQTVH